MRRPFRYAEVEVWGAAHLVLFVLWEQLRDDVSSGIFGEAKFEVGVDGAAHFVCFFVRVAARGIRGILILLMEEGRA